MPHGERRAFPRFPIQFPANLEAVDGAALPHPAHGCIQNISYGGFALVTFSLLRSHNPARRLPLGKSYLTVGFSELAQTFRELRRLRHTFRYLMAYLFFIDGVQTIIGMAGVFMAQELFVARGQEASPAFLLGIFLMVQFMAIFGALLFERVAALVGTKRAIMASLFIWSGIVIYAYGFLQTTTQAWWMAGIIAIVLGGTQALSRGLYSRMIPAGREASFFGLYEISERASWMGMGMRARRLGPVQRESSKNQEVRNAS